MVAVKLPSAPEIDVTSDRVSSSILMCRPTSTSLGEMIHIEQSLVGNVLSSLDIVPPIDDSSLIMWTRRPLLARSSAACIPPIPEPTTNTDPVRSCPGALLVKTTSLDQPLTACFPATHNIPATCLGPNRVNSSRQSYSLHSTAVPLSWIFGSMTISFLTKP